MSAAPGRGLRILTFIHSFEPGGVERIALRLCGEWHRAGAHVTLAAGRRAGRLRSELPDIPVRCAARAWFPRRLFETVWMLLWLPGIVRRERPDLLFCPGNSYAIVAVVLRWRLGRRCPPIVAKVSNDLQRVDFPPPLRALYHLWCRIQGRWIDHFVAMSPPMRFEIARLMRARRQRVSSIHDPVIDAAAVARLAALAHAAGQPRTGRRFLAVGRLVRQKNFPALIDAFAAGSGPDDVLAIAGDGPHRRRLAARIAKTGMAGRIRLLGHVGDVIPLMAESDFLVISSLYEGVPAVLVEGLAAGLRPIATDCCVTMRELVVPTGGHLVPTGDDDTLAAAIAGAVRRDQADAAASRIVAQHGAAHSAAAYLDLFRRIACTPAGEAHAAWSAAA